MSAQPTISANTLPPVFGREFHEALDALLVWRRDVRHFQTRPLDEALLAYLLEQAAMAPSVGLSQPWRFVRVREDGRRSAVRTIFERCNADALANQQETQAGLYARLKLAGLDQAPEQFAVFVEPEPEEGHGLGRATMPETVAYSSVMAIHTLWLAAAAHGIGLGWVSILDPQAVNEALDVPARWRLVGYLCLGYPSEASLVPELERLGWEHRRPAGDFLIER